MIYNDPWWPDCMALLSKWRVKHLLTDEKGLVICPRELLNGFKHRKTPGWAQVSVASSAWQSQSTNDGVFHAVHRREWGHYSRATPRPSQGIISILIQGVTPVPFKELPPVDQDMAMAGGDGNEGQDNEEHARLTTSVTEDAIPTTAPKLGPSFATLFNDLQPAIRNQSQSEWKWLHSWDEFKQKEAS